MPNYEVKDLMAASSQVIGQERTLKEAAEAMAKTDCGIKTIRKPLKHT